MKKTCRRVLWIFCILLIIIGVTQAFPHAERLEKIIIAGRLAPRQEYQRLKITRKNTLLSAKPGMPLKFGDKLRTDSEITAVIVLGETEIILSPNSQVQIKNTSMYNYLGRTWVHGLYAVQTQRILASVSEPAQFLVTVKENNAVDVIVIDGHVTLRDNLPGHRITTTIGPSETVVAETEAVSAPVKIEPVTRENIGRERQAIRDLREPLNLLGIFLISLGWIGIIGMMMPWVLKPGSHSSRRKVLRLQPGPRNATVDSSPRNLGRVYSTANHPPRKLGRIHPDLKRPPLQLNILKRLSSPPPEPPGMEVPLHMTMEWGVSGGAGIHILEVIEASPGHRPAVVCPYCQELLTANSGHEDATRRVRPYYYHRNAVRRCTYFDNKHEHLLFPFTGDFFEGLRYFSDQQRQALAILAAEFDTRPFTQQDAEMALAGIAQRERELTALIRHGFIHTHPDAGNYTLSNARYVADGHLRLAEFYTLQGQKIIAQRQQIDQEQTWLQAAEQIGEDDWPFQNAQKYFRTDQKLFLCELNRFLRHSFSFSQVNLAGERRYRVTMNPCPKTLDHRSRQCLTKNLPQEDRRICYCLPRKAYVEPYFKFRFALHQTGGYFTFSEDQLCAVLQECDELQAVELPELQQLGKKFEAKGGYQTCDPND